MAERRMFAKTIIDSDAFLDMPPTTQLLYFHLSMRADDDGFINNPKSITRNVKCGDDDLKLLCAKKFIIPFESGVVVIKHWKIHNYIAKDRYKETKYKKEKSELSFDENSSYKKDVDELYTERIQVVDGLSTQVRLGKVSIGKDKNIVQISSADLSVFFEKLWKLYPNKKGKAQISDSKKKALILIGEEKLIICIERYKTELKKDEWRKAQNGSTFFNGGYIDYLDENYEPCKAQKQTNNKFNNFEGRNYDIDDLERKMMDAQEARNGL